jgi:hypothetical protein
MANKFITCECCEGTGIAITSNCCDATYNSDIMICEHCYEHLGDNKCDECNGEGKILNHIDTKNDY